MKTALVRVLPVLFFFVFAKFADAGDFQSVVVSTTTGNNPFPINVLTGHFLVIRNFTQVGGTGTPRGLVTATLLSGTNPMVEMLQAAFLDPAMKPEVINNVVVAGPATVSVACDPAVAAACFITYRKGDD
jgi:hypothetical protein